MALENVHDARFGFYGDFPRTQYTELILARTNRIRISRRVEDQRLFECPRDRFSFHDLFRFFSPRWVRLSL